MTSVDDSGTGMTTVQVPRGAALVLQLDNVKDFMRRCPEQYSEILECTAFANWRRSERGEPPILMLSFAI